MSLNPAFPNHLVRPGGSRGWRRHVRRWKSAHALAVLGDKAARAWLGKHRLPVPPHPHERSAKSSPVSVQPEPVKVQPGPVEIPRTAKRLIWAGLPSASNQNNPCPACDESDYRSDYKDTNEGKRFVLTCLECGCTYRPYVAPTTDRAVASSRWLY